MHQGFEKDYRFLLSVLIPRHLLSSERVEGIRRALTAGTRAGMVKEAWLAMEELVTLRVFERGDPVRVNGEVHVHYMERTGPSRITLELPQAEFNSVTGGESIQAGIVPSVLAGIISALSLDDSPINITGRIENLLDLAESIDQGSSAFLMLFREFEAPGIRKSDRIKESSLVEAEAGGFYGKALKSGEVTVSATGGESSGLGGLKKGDARSIMLYPLRSGGLVYGVLEIHAVSKGKPSEEKISNYRLVARGIVRALDNNRHLERMVSIDSLTGVNNRNNYESQLPLEMERATRNRKCLGFLMIDIDDFKQFNDMHGHDTGDKVLKLVAQTIRKHLRKIDQLFRFGGEEFIALLPGAGRDAAERTAERIREVVESSSLFMDDGTEIGITISIGGCIFPVDAGDEQELFRKADQAMYKAKREGKNRISFFGG